MEDLSAQREQMVERQSAARGIVAPAVLEAMAEVRRERFVDPILVELAYEVRAVLPRQFDESCWFDGTEAVIPLGREAGEGLPETFPFGV